MPTNQSDAATPSERLPILRSRQRCVCARHLDADFECRADRGACPRSWWFPSVRRAIGDRGPASRGRDEIRRMGVTLDLPDDVVESAERLFAHARDAGLLSGRTVEGVAAAALYAAARQSGTPRTLREVGEVSRVSRSDVGRIYRRFTRELDVPLVTASPTDYLPRYATRLSVTAETERVAERVLDAAERRGLQSGREPVSLVAAALYVAGLLTNDRIGQAAISAATGVSTDTIRRRYREVLDELDDEFTGPRPGE